MRPFVSSSGSPASARRSVTRASSRDLASRTAKPLAISADTDSARPSSTSRDAHSYNSSFSEMPIFLVIPQSYHLVIPQSHRMSRCAPRPGPPRPHWPTPWACPRPAPEKIEHGDISGIDVVRAYVAALGASVDVAARLSGPKLEGSLTTGQPSAACRAAGSGFKSLAAHPYMPRDLRKRVRCPLPCSEPVNFSVNKVNTLLPARVRFRLRGGRRR